MQRLEGRVAVVTGAARGIGRAIALAYAREGARIVGVDLDAEGLGEAIAEIEAMGGTGLARTADVADAGAMQSIIGEAATVLGRLDILVNNVATFEPEITNTDTDVVRTPIASWDRIYGVNIRAPFLASKFAVPLMLETSGAGNIINISSTSGFHGDVNYVAYSSTKAAMHALTRSIATSHGRFGIRANCIATGLVLTETAQRNVSAEMLEVWRRHRLVPEVGTPEDIAPLAVFLASDESRYLIGQTIVIDGGTSSVHQPWYVDSAVLHPDLVGPDFNLPTTPPA
jgi:NAD(P)-dependent dehydrogenase (short-subunit alcohol dehydrogenase family)